jgi:hypothetical protein
MPLRFVLDEQLRGPLWRAIERHNVQGVDLLDVVRVGDRPDLPVGSTDPEILLWAERESRVLITRDLSTMPVHLADHLTAGHHSPGVLTIRPRSSIPQVIFSLVLHAHAGGAVVLEDRISFIP